jgi:hypothetical protein
MRRFRCSPRSLHDVFHGAHHRASRRRARAKRRPARAAAERVAGRLARRRLLRRGAAARRARRRGAAAPVRCPQEALVSAVRRKMQCRQRCLPQRLRAVRSRRIPRPSLLAAAAARSRTRSVCARSGSGSASWMRRVWRCSGRWRRLQSMARGVCALTHGVFQLAIAAHTHGVLMVRVCVCVVEQREHGAIYERGAGASGEARVSQRAAGSADGGGEGRTRAGASGSGGVSEGTLYSPPPMAHYR